MKFWRNCCGAKDDGAAELKRLFENELTVRGLAFSVDRESARHVIAIGGGTLHVCLDNLERDFQSDRDIGRISRFVDAIEQAAEEERTETFTTENLFWSLERNDYVEKPDFTELISDQLDKVLIHESGNGRLLTWFTPQILESLGIDDATARRKASENLQRALTETKVEFQDIDGTKLGFLNSQLPFKTSLILAPNLEQVVRPVLGWPLLAVVPDRSFLYLWDASHHDFCQRVGQVVVREYSQSAYPLSTEVLEISDEGIRAIGEFPVS